MPITRQPVISGALKQDWSNFAVVANEVTGDAVRDWISQAVIRGARCEGPIAIFPQGSLRSPVSSMSDNIRKKLTERGVIPAVATAVGNSVGQGFEKWAAGYETRVPTAFPMFAAYPLPAAIPHPMLPHPLRLGVSNAEGNLNPPALVGSIKAGIGPSANETAADGAITAFVGLFNARFHAWNTSAILVNLVGGGPSKLAPLPGPIFGTVQGDHVLGGPHQF